jgi:hypothetical protein
MDPRNPTLRVFGPEVLFWVRVAGPTKPCQCETQANIETLLRSASYSRGSGVWFTSEAQRTCMPQLKTPDMIQIDSYVA